MKSLLIFFCLPLLLQAQSADTLQVIKVNPHITTHFICPDPVDFIDLSANDITGDIPAKNIVRIKPEDSLHNAPSILTIVGQKYMVQYRLVFAPANQCQSAIDVSGGNLTAIDDPDNPMSESELSHYANQVLKARTWFHAVSSYKDGIEAKVLSVVSKGEYFFVKVRLKNHTKILYDIDEVRFSIDDRKILSATNNQSIEIKPVYQLCSQKAFWHTWENVYVFKKFTFPGVKDFTIRFSESQISGRQISIHVSYSDVLNADAL